MTILTYGDVKIFLAFSCLNYSCSHERPETPAPYTTYSGPNVFSTSCF